MFLIKNGYNPYLLPLKHQYSVNSNVLSWASFRFHLAMNALAFDYVIPAIRACSGLSPVRQSSCRAY